MADLWQRIKCCDFHLHTRFSDGQGSPDQLLQACKNAGLRRVAITDHCETGHVCDISTRWDEYMKDLQALRKKAANEGITLLYGIETGIGPDGKLKAPDFALDAVDLVIASVHKVNLPPGENVKTLPSEVYWEFYRNQIMLAAQSKDVDVLGHVEGYLVMDWTDLGGRTFAERRAIEKRVVAQWFPLDWYAELAHTAAANNTAIELHGLSESPRLEAVRVLKEGGALFSLGSDAHKLEHVGYLDYIKHVIDAVHLQPDDFAPFVGLTN